MTKANQSGRDADPRRTIPLNSARWRKLRAYILNESPMCEHCMDRGILTPATDVDHVNGDPSDNSMANLQSLCHSCHSIKTARDHGKNVAMGCDLNGMPLDPSHPWNVAPGGCTQAVDASVRQKSRGADGTRPAAPPSFNADC